MVTYRAPHPLEIQLFQEIRARVSELQRQAAGRRNPETYRKVDALIRVLVDAGLVPSPRSFHEVVAIDEPDLLAAAAPEFIAECNAALDKALRGAHEA